MKATNIDRTKSKGTQRPIVIRGQQVRKSGTIKSKGCGCGWKSYSSR